MEAKPSNLPKSFIDQPVVSVNINYFFTRKRHSLFYAHIYVSMHKSTVNVSVFAIMSLGSRGCGSGSL